MPIPEVKQDRWSALPLKDRADLISLFVEYGVTNPKQMRGIFNGDMEHALTSNKDFVQRLRDYPNTPIIENEDGSHSSHLMNTGEDDEGGYVWPSIQRINGELVDFRNDEDRGLQSAIEHNDTLRMHPAVSRWYGPNYKKYYPNIRATGGPLRNILSGLRRTIGHPYRQISDDEVIDTYINDILWTMENPRNIGYNSKDGLYYAYTDKDNRGNVHTNIGPGLEKNGHPNIDYSRGYTKEELNKIARGTVKNRVSAVTKSMDTMDNGKYAITRDTLSMGPLLIATDIAYNVGTKDKNNLPEKWPGLMAKLATGDWEGIVREKQTRSGSDRRMLMRNDLLTSEPITPTTVKNR